MRTRSQFFYILTAAFLSFTLSSPVLAQSMDEGSGTEYMDDSQPYACYKGPETGGKVLFGEMNPKTGKFKAIDNTAKLEKKIAALNKTMEQLNKKARTPGAAGSKAKAKLKIIKKGMKLVKKGQKFCKNVNFVTPTPAPTATSTPQPTPSGPQSGNAYSLSAYSNQALTESECKHFLRKVAFGGSKELLAKCVEKGLNAVIDDLIAATSAIEAETEPAVFTYEYQSKYPNVEYRDGNSGTDDSLYLVGPDASAQLFEETILPRLVNGSPLKERLTYELMDWFAVDVSSSNCSNTSGSLHSRCVYPYYKLYRDNALNFDSAPLAGTFENLLQKQVYSVAMQFWLNNSNNCNINSQSANENFGRELMELFSLGTHDLRGIKTYDNQSVIAASEAASGYSTVWNGTDTYFNVYYCPNFKTEKTLFPNSAWGTDATFKINNPDISQHYPELVRGIIYKHPQSPIYIAGQLFSRLVHQSIGADDSTDLLMAQASDLMMNKYKYHIGNYVRDVMKSSAMFSKEAYRSAIATPTDTFVRFMRLLEVPVVDRGIVVAYSWVECTVNNKNQSHPDFDPICLDSRFIQSNKQMRIERQDNGKLKARSQYVSSASDVSLATRNALDASGDLPGQPASVFGRSAGTAGKWRGNQVSKGHEALSTQYLLERINGLSNVLFAANAVNVVTSLDAKYANKDNSEAAYVLSDKYEVATKTQEQVVKLFEELLDVPLSDEERKVMTDYLGSDFQTITSAKREVRMKGLLLLFYHHGLFLLS